MEKPKKNNNLTLTLYIDRIIIIPVENILYITSMSNPSNGCHIYLKGTVDVIDVQETWQLIQTNLI